MSLNVGLISLGCAKNLIDSEVMAGYLKEAGMALVEDVSEADVVVVNTCSFIDKAKQESIDTILGVAKENCKIIVAGCLAQRYSAELPKLLPEVDAFIGVDEINRIVSVIEDVMAGTVKEKTMVSKVPTYVLDFDTPRYQLTPSHAAYIKIAEGCNHGCAFCAIPLIRGRHRSRTQESVVKEAKALLKAGVKEINLIAQDTTYFGMDRWTGEERAGRRSGVDSTKGESLSSLLRELNSIEGDFWIRVLYTHPAHWSDELIETYATCEKVVPYVDIPLQHISDHMLKKMNRVTDGDYVRDLLRKMKERIPNLAIRSGFIVGFPGETDDDFEELLDFIEEFGFMRSGVFTYSREEGTKAYKMTGQVHERIKQSRCNEATELLHRLASEYGESRIGQKIRVLVESPGLARSVWDAPDVDGTVSVPKSLPVGEFAEVTVVDSVGYDLIAE